MCVIFHFAAGAMMPKEAFTNAVHNNPDGWGLILKDGNGKLQVLRDCPEGGNDPEVLWKLIETNKDIERFLHVRHSTKGAINVENTHPFPVFSSNDRDVYFMHNGTLPNFGSTGYTVYSHNNNYGRVNNGEKVEGKSDTLDFCEKILVPALQYVVGENGRADYHNKMFQELILQKNWGGNSKGLFISNDLNPYYHGNGWELFDKEDTENVVWVSNKDYFKAVTRGPFFERQKAEAARFQEEQRQKEAKEREEKALTSRVSGVTGPDTTNHDVLSFDQENLMKSMVIIRALGGMFLDADINTLSGVANLAGVDIYEWQKVVEDESAFYVATCISHICDALHDANLENIKLEEDNKRLRGALEKMNLEKKAELKRVG